MLMRAFRVLSGSGAKSTEFDTARPGPPRRLTGLFHQLDEEQKRRVLLYKGAEYAGGPDKKIA